MAKVKRAVMITATIVVEIEDSIHPNIDDDFSGWADPADILHRRAEAAGSEWAEKAGLDNYDINSI